MLLNITVENFRSYNEPQTLSFIARDDSGINEVTIGEYSIRKSAVIYGANASGKSSFIMAIAKLQLLLANDLHPHFYEPFFDNQEPNKLSIDFTIDEQVFTYTVHYDADKLHYESLLDYDDNIIYQRTIRDQSKNISANYDYQFPSDFIFDSNNTADGLIKTAWTNSVSEKKLFLSHSDQYANDKLRMIKTAILAIKIPHNMPYNNVPYNTDVYQYVMYHLTEFVKHYDQQDLVEKLRSIGNRFDSLEVMDDVIPLINGTNQKIKTVLTRYDGKAKQLNFVQESMGTQFFLYHFMRLHDIADKDSILIVDELETHLHPFLVEDLVRFVHCSDRKVQLLFTTHQTDLLQDSLFERDQIYFTERDDNLATELYSLADFSDLQESDNIRAKYRGGRFGAVPHVVLNEIMRKDHK